jgi:hypothetical protein
MKGSTVVKGRVVQGEKDEVVSAAGLHPLGEFAERLGLVETLREAIGWRGNGIPLRDRGVLAVQLMLMLAGVGAVCSKIERLRCEEELFGTVASDTTLWRTFTETIDEAARSRVEVVFRDAREVMWEKLGFLDGDDTVILDIDATLVNTHSDDHKELTGPNYKGGYGMHPMACFADCTGEALSFLLRPGNATANDAKDHLTVLDAAVDALPAVLAAGHRVGDPPDAVLREMLVRADSAGCTAEFVAGCGKRNIRFAVTVRQTKDVARAAGYAHIVHKNRWRRAVDQNGKVSEKNKAWVCEITDLVTPPKGMPAGTRTILRRERRHPGAQRSLFPDENWRFWAHYTDSDLNPVELDRQMRAHAHCEASIQRLQTTFRVNRNWLS